MLGKSKARIHTDVVYFSAYKFSLGGGIIEDEPAQWLLYFSRTSERGHNCGMAYERCFTFVTKPTRKQVRKARKSFKIGYDMYENYY